MSTTWQRKVARALFSCLLAALPTVAAAQEPTGFEYVVKFVCGEGDARVVAKGQYYTAINVHNPNEGKLAFKKKFAIALPSEKAGRVTKFFEAALGPDEAFEVDCPDIFQHTEMKGWVKGFAVIESERELDVVAVYTAAGATGAVETMDVEHVKPRIRGGGGTGGQPDLIPVEVKPQYCNRDGLNLIVTIRNQGTGPAGPSTTRVVFNTGASPTQPTPALAVGAQVDLTFAIPAACFNPDCQFRITADSAGAVTESNEANNTVSGTCLG
jgi:CARDB protein